MKFNVKIVALSLLAGLILLLPACREKEQTAADKKAELVKMKKQLQELKIKITELEKEIGEDRTTKGIVFVDVAQIQKSDFERFIDVQGTVESDRVSVLSTKMGGNVMQILVQEGDIVKKGQLLIKIDDAMLQRSLDELNTRLIFVKDVYERQKRLWEQKAGSEMQYLQAKNNYDALAKKKKTLEEQIKDMRITAPFTGSVDMIFPKVGEMLMPGRPAVKITDMANVKIIANISESYLTTIRRGLPVKINLSDIGVTAEGKIVSVSKSIDPKNRTFRAEIRLKRIPKNLRPYQLCDVSINDVSKSNVLTVPLAYVQRSGDKSYVFVVDEKNMTARKRYIKTGLDNNTVIEVLEGLQEGEKIITNGVFDVADGQKIKIVGQK
jgi:RND family efflux transporter MFP subunit